MHSPASASALVEARPGIGISAFRRFLPAVSTQTFARNLAVFVMFLSLFELYKFSTLLHRSTFVFSAFRALPPFFQILQAPPHPSRSFPKIAYRLVGRPKRCKMPSNAFLFCYNRCRSRCPRAKGQRAEESATQPSFSIFFSFFSFFRFASFFLSEFSGTTPKNGFSPRLSPDGPAIAGRLDSSWQTVLCAPLFAQGWATCSSAEHGGWSSPPVCEPRQQACCRDRVVAERPRLDFANSLGGVAPPPICSD